MRYAIIIGGKVENILEAPAHFNFGTATAIADPNSQAVMGGTWDGTSFGPPGPPQPVVPAWVTDLQFRLALNAAGLREAAEAYVAGASQDIKDYWDRATIIRRDHAFITAATAALNKTEADLDAIFIAAAGM